MGIDGGCKGADIRGVDNGCIYGGVCLMSGSKDGFGKCCSFSEGSISKGKKKNSQRAYEYMCVHICAEIYKTIELKYNT